ncbi:helix-turn-helix transcriptional regulator [Leptolyngbya sp. AN03gr2]|uniref:helix-turn-helix transcriptional regulator n=1 Tax=unclassified Leptolyngbya TaxID=2650499 RepID=UPI003D318541
MDSIVSQQSSATWSEIVPQDWIQESRTISDRGLVVRHEFQASSEVDVSNGCADDMLAFHFNRNLRQVTRIDGHEYDGALSPGSIFLLPAQVPAFCYWECEQADETASFYIDPQQLQQVAAENDCLYPERIELRPILHTYDNQLAAIATAFRSEMYSNSLGGKLYTESLANQFLIHLLRNYCTQTPTLRSFSDGLSYTQLQTAIDFINDHLSGDFKLQDAANQLGMSQYYFCRLFKQSMGIAPYQYVLQQRIETAKRLLIKQPDKAIAQIALD